MAKNRRRSQKERTMPGQGQVTLPIDVLHDDVLLVVFDFYVAGEDDSTREVESWQSLVHVCRRWRSLVFGSPRRLNLRLVVTNRTRVRDIDIWPPLPLIIMGSMAFSDTGNIIAALRHSNHVREISLGGLIGWQVEQVLAAMQVPFPELTELRLWSYDEELPVIPDLFLNGSATRLRVLDLDGLPFPGLPKLLLSANHLVYLKLSNVPHSGYISPEAMVALLSVLSSLESLYLEFQSPESRPDLESPSLHPPERSILPALHYLSFQGVTGYLEELVTRIDAPQLYQLCITFFDDIDFGTPGLAQFIHFTPTLRALDDGHVQFDDDTVGVKLQYRRTKSGPGDLQIDIACTEPDLQLSSIMKVCSSLSTLSIVEDLYIEEGVSEIDWKDDGIDITLWLQLLLRFTAVKNLYLSREFARGIAIALQELAGSKFSEVLPSLENIFVQGLEPSGPLRDNIGKFIAASGHPIAMSSWE